MGMYRPAEESSWELNSESPAVTDSANGTTSALCNFTSFVQTQRSNRRRRNTAESLFQFSVGSPQALTTSTSIATTTTMTTKTATTTTTVTTPSPPAEATTQGVYATVAITPQATLAPGEFDAATVAPNVRDS